MVKNPQVFLDAFDTPWMVGKIEGVPWLMRWLRGTEWVTHHKIDGLFLVPDNLTAEQQRMYLPEWLK